MFVDAQYTNPTNIIDTSNPQYPEFLSKHLTQQAIEDASLDPGTIDQLDAGIDLHDERTPDPRLWEQMIKTADRVSQGGDFVERRGSVEYPAEVVTSVSDVTAEADRPGQVEALPPAEQIRTIGQAAENLLTVRHYLLAKANDPERSAA